MSLKDLIEEDIYDVFLDIDDFAVERFVEGEKIRVVEDNDILKELKGGMMDEIGEADRAFYAKCSDLPPRKGYGTLIDYDGVDYIVLSWTEDFGMALVTMKANGGY